MRQGSSGAASERAGGAGGARRRLARVAGRCSNGELDNRVCSQLGAHVPVGFTVFVPGQLIDIRESAPKAYPPTHVASHALSHPPRATLDPASRPDWSHNLTRSCSTAVVCSEPVPLELPERRDPLVRRPSPASSSPLHLTVTTALHVALALTCIEAQTDVII